MTIYILDTFLIFGCDVKKAGIETFVHISLFVGSEESRKVDVSAVGYRCLGTEILYWDMKSGILYPPLRSLFNQ